MSDHELKLDTAYFFAAEVGDKPFEVRYNDRDYKIGDTLLLREYLPESETYTGKSIRRKITYVLTDERYVLPGYAILGLSIHSPAEERYKTALEELRRMEYEHYGHSTYVSEFIDQALTKSGEHIVDKNEMVKEDNTVQNIIEAIEEEMCDDFSPRAERINKQLAELRVALGLPALSGLEDSDA